MAIWLDTAENRGSVLGMQKETQERMEEIHSDAMGRFMDSNGKDSLKAARVSQDEAGEILDAYWGIMRDHPEYKTTLRLRESLDQELARGWRCAVCLDIDNDDCIEGC